MENTKQQYLTLIDGSSYIFRAYFAIKRLEGVNAIYGFCSMLLKVLEEMVRENDGIPDNEKIVIVFDHSRKTWRSEVFPEYKANRTSLPEDLRPQFATIFQLPDAFGLPSLAYAGYEADDIIATYAEQAKAHGYITRIISSDKDLMQLVDDKKQVHMYDSMKDKQIFEANVFEKFGIAPHQVPDVQGLIGDSSDNIPGVRGMGPKTAAKLIQEFGNIENLIANIEKITNPKEREKLEGSKDLAILSKRLATLTNDVPLKVHLNDLPHLSINEEGMKKIIDLFEFDSLKWRFEGFIQRFKDSYGEEFIKNKDVPLTVPKSVAEFQTTKLEKPTQGSLF